MPNRGGSKGRAKPSVRSLSRERLTREEFHPCLDELTGASDRACALLSAAMLDNALRDLLSTYMRSDWDELVDVVFDNQTAPLKDFSAKIKTAYALDAITHPARAKLDCVRLIRNAFAHSEKPISFDTPLITGECRHLMTARPPWSTAKFIPRNVFVSTTIELLLYLNTRHDERREGAAAAAIADSHTPPLPEK